MRDDDVAGENEWWTRLEKLGPGGGNYYTKCTEQDRINVYGPNIGHECQKGQKEVEEWVGNSQKQTKETVRKKVSNLLCDDVEIR